MNDFLKAMDFRHACKIFDESKKISDEDIKFILECGRKSPSSLGMEPWKFIVITNPELKAKIRPFCWDQVQITSCSHLVVVLAKIQDLKIETGIPLKKFERRGLDRKKTEAYLKKYEGFAKNILSSDTEIYNWTSRQCHIAAANMMSAAAFIGIDSCPIGGYEKEKLENFMKLDSSVYQIALLLPFGYRINPQSKQLRDSFEKVVEFVK